MTVRRDLAEIDAALRRRLEEISAEHQQILAQARQWRAGALNVTDVAEDGSLTSESEQDDLVALRLRRQAQQLTMALERLKSGSYGKCQLCGQTIAAQRLAAVPAATCCVACQEQQERRYR